MWLPWRKAKAPERSGRRSFDAAKANRLTASWLASTASIDRELRGQLDMLRKRSRDLFRNNEYAKKFGRMVRSNVVGPTGFTLQVQSKDASNNPDTADNNAIEAAFAQFARKGICEISGRYSMADAERALISGGACRDGEFIVRLIRGPAAGNRFNFAFQILDTDRLDTTFNIEPAHGRNAVVMGVEMDAYRRPVAYWIHQSHPNGSGASRRDRDRVPAADIIHAFVPDDETEQTRGIPWMHASMLRLHDLGGYREAAIVASRIGAQQMGFFTSKDGDLSTLADNDSESQDIDGLEMDAEAGVFRSLPEGYDFKAFNPDYPHQQFDMFVKSCLRGIAAGFGVSYNSLANDLEGVNFSSIRSGTLEERDEWTILQNWFIESFLIPIYEAWLEMALLSGAITDAKNKPLPANKKEKFLSHAWQGRRWSWVDPLKDMNANLLAIKNGLSSPQRVAASMGVDVEDVLNELKQFSDMLDEKDVVLAGDSPPVPGAPDDNKKDSGSELAAAITALSEREVPAANVTVNPADVHVTPAPVEVKVGDTINPERKIRKIKKTPVRNDRGLILHVIEEEIAEEKEEDQEINHVN